MPYYFISDLHLSKNTPEINSRFIDFLDVISIEGNVLYILGDFFDVWIGDDIQDDLIQIIKSHLRKAVDLGLNIYLMHGNRDFLLGERFCSETLCELLPDPFMLQIYNRRTVLSHGDSLCTDDIGYQRLRKIVRNPFVQACFLSLPKRLRQNIAGKIRSNSIAHQERKSSDILDVSPAAVEKLFLEQDCEVLIHGHTHRPARHSLTVNNQQVERNVLSDWKVDQGQVLIWNENGMESKFFKKAEGLA